MGDVFINTEWLAEEVRDCGAPYWRAREARPKGERRHRKEHKRRKERAATDYALSSEPADEHWMAAALPATRDAWHLPPARTCARDG